ncbi:MAG: hypothetical protein AVDCRST_MAG73-4045 [uncultured Thermomicrobiales bacterium]|uniref:VWFA domain-containing protein n=1 Tax=uncultured Thermomicrobiales bacterium TaxID=1645740 RepID=A0A6J4UYV9_9BACT|nr:MAG: hypothetical protein AVDCRST_MAG73-4045 [uncultured Thermomicrobiales bacterium]
MGLLTPLALGLAALAVPIVVLYLLKIKRRDRVVPSTLLWDRLARDVEANAPWQRFRPNWLLFLQLLALAALVAALARPFLSVEAALGASTVVVVDVSASMGAVEGDGTRLDAAKGEIRDLIARMPDGGRMLLVAAGAQGRVAQPMTGDRDALRDSLDALNAEAGQAAIADALALAAAAAARLPDGEIVLVSDGDIPASTIADLAAPTRVVAVGGADPLNLGITTMAVRRGVAGAQLFVRVANAGTAEREARITLWSEPEPTPDDPDAADVLVAAQDLTVPAHGDVALTFAELPPDASVLRADLAAGGRDDLTVDDTAWARTRSGDGARVLLVTAGNLFLERGLGLLPDLAVSVAEPGAVASGYDIYVFDGVAPTPGLAAPMLLLNPPVGNGVVEVSGAVETPAITGTAGADPLLGGVDLSQTNLAAAAKLVTPSWATAAVVAGPDPLLLSGTRDGARVAVLAFDLHQSDLPLQTAFPVLLANLTGFLLPETGGATPATVSPGAVVPLRPRAGADTVEVTPPGSDPLRIPAQTELLFADTARPGSYLVRDLAAETPLRAGGFTVNLLDAAESDLHPAPDAAVAGAAARAGTALRSGDARRFLWWPAIALGVAVLALEWWAFYRGRLPGVGRMATMVAFPGRRSRAGRNPSRLPFR